MTEFSEDELERQRGILRQQEVQGDDSFEGSRIVYKVPTIKFLIVVSTGLSGCLITLQLQLNFAPRDMGLLKFFL